jgi:glycosyltransferase involved in cell wall biosynthesis
MKLSLILTGAERHAEMHRFFRSLLSQKKSDFSIEVIFINQGDFVPPRDDLAASGILLREIRSGQLSLSKARNIALAEANGDIYAFPDDDCWYPEDLLLNIAVLLENNANLDAICTNVYDPILQLNYGGRPVGVDYSINYCNLFKLPISVGLFIRWKAFQTAGYFFDEQLGAGTSLGSGEETDLVYRLLRHGFRMEYRGTLQVFHPVPEYQETDIAKFYKYGRGFGFLNGAILRDGEFRVLIHFAHVLFRSFGGVILNIFSSTHRKIYFFRLLGVCHGFIQGLKKNADC